MKSPALIKIVQYVSAIQSHTLNRETLISIDFSFSHCWRDDAIKICLMKKKKAAVKDWSINMNKL